MIKEGLLNRVRALIDVISTRDIKPESCSIMYSAETLPIYDDKALSGWYEGKKKQIIISWEEE